MFVDDDGQVVVEWKKQQNMRIAQSFHYYEGMEGNNKIFENRSSGAYIFRPRTASTKDFTEVVSHKIYTGNILLKYRPPECSINEADSVPVQAQW